MEWNFRLFTKIIGMLLPWLLSNTGTVLIHGNPCGISMVIHAGFLSVCFDLWYKFNFSDMATLADTVHLPAYPSLSWILFWEWDESDRVSEADSSLWSFRILQRISAHLLMLGRFCFCGAKHCNASSRIFSSARLFAAFLSSLGSKVKIASPSVNFFMACMYYNPSLNWEKRRFLSPIKRKEHFFPRKIKVAIFGYQMVGDKKWKQNNFVSSYGDASRLNWKRR